MKKLHGYLWGAFGLGVAIVGCQADLAERDPSKTTHGSLTVSALDGRCRRLALLSGRQLDAYTTKGGNVVTRSVQSDGTQNWCFTLRGNQAGVPYYTIQHRDFAGQFLDAHVGAQDHKAVLGDAETNGSQDWLLGAAGAGYDGAGGADASEGPQRMRVRQRSSGRYLDAYTTGTNDYRAITRERQDDGTQVWSAPPP